MKRFLLVLMILTMSLSLLAGCKSHQQEEDAVLDQVYQAEDEKEAEPEEQEEETPEKQEEETPEQQEEEEIPEKQEEETPEKQEETPEKQEEAPEETPAETPEETPVETPEEEPAEEAEPDYSDYIKVASYNTKCLMYSADKEGIVAELKEIDADIVGIQEIDSFNSRSGQYNQMEYLAKEAGYPYWSFDKLIDSGGGEYGMGILSRYPIKSSEVVQYGAQCAEDSHVRKYGRHVLDVDGKEVVFYNTHLAIRDGEDETSVPQLKELLERMNKDPYAVLTGDFNMKAPVAAKAVSGYKNVQILNNGDSSLTAYIGDKLASDFIDNIMTTKNFDTYWDDWSGTGIAVSETEYSDHNLVYTYVKFK